jgi:hypothetical protein
MDMLAGYAVLYFWLDMLAMPDRLSAYAAYAS